ncbi:Lipoxygenase, partial [Corchorus capsularis]
MGTQKHKIQATVVIIGRIPCNEAGNFVSATPYQISLQLSSQKQNVSFRLVSADNSNIGDPAYLEDRNVADSICSVNFDWDEKFGTPGAILVRNSLENTEFYLKSVTLENVPGRGRIHFVCNSWVYKDEKYQSDRVFFTNKTYLPHEMPEPLRKYREEELRILRGNGDQGELKAWDRVYDYALYNDLGDPDKGSDYKRQTLGGNSEFPYPRRGKTGRAPTQSGQFNFLHLQLIMF